MKDVAYYGETTLHPLGLVAIVVLGCALLGVPRRYAIIPVLVMACFIAPAQRIVIASLDFSLLRIMVLFGWTRLIVWNEFRGVRVQPVDVVIALWALVGLATYTMYHGSMQALVFRLGSTFDAIGFYVLFRCLIRGWDDIDVIVRALIAISVPVAAFFAIEWITGRNMFSVLGGVPQVTEVRGGRLRCQGAFSHPILAGCFWASMLPIFAVYRRPGAWPWGWAAVGISTCVALVLMSSSSTPAMGLIFGVIGLAMFTMRRFMGFVQLAGVIVAVLLHFIMNGPVWGLLARVNVLSSSTGWHRYALIDQAIQRFDEWWLLGTHSTAHWGWGLWDVTNQYILEGVRGGFFTMLLFIVAIVMTFWTAGRLRRTVEMSRPHRLMAWAMGVMLFVHSMNFIAVSYFGQIIVVWYLTLAMIISLTPPRHAMPRATRTPSAPTAPRPMMPPAAPPAHPGFSHGRSMHDPA